MTGATSLANVYLIGAPKAGTTSIAAWLAAHPEVFVTTPKEPFHWASDYPRMRELYGFADRASYAALFDDDAARRSKVRVDASTTYLYSADAVPAILANIGEPRFLVCVRNPLEQIVSYHRTQAVALNEPEPDFETAWRRGPGDVTGSPLDPKLLDYDMVGRQGAALRQVMRQAGRDNVHVLVFDDIVERPDQVWNDLLDVLALERCPRPPVDRQNASNKTYRSKVLRRLTHRPPAAIEPVVRRLRQWARTSDHPAVARAKSTLWKSAERPAVRPEFRAELADNFRDDVALLGELVGRDLRGWLGD